MSRSSTRDKSRIFLISVSLIDSYGSSEFNRYWFLLESDITIEFPQSVCAQWCVVSELGAPTSYVGTCYSIINIQSHSNVPVLEALRIRFGRNLTKAIPPRTTPATKNTKQ